MSEKHKNVCKPLNYFEHFLVFVSVVSVCASMSAFASLVGITVGITSFSVALKICAITAWIKTYKPVIKKKRKVHHRIVLLEKDKLHTIKVLICKVLIDCMFMMNLFQ